MSAIGTGGPSPVLLATGADAVYAALRDAIVSGGLPAGARLTEVELCRRFGLSTTPVREALQRLVHRGLAVRAVARGVKVRTLSPRDIQDIYELRLLLEPSALRASVPNLTHAGIEALGAMLSRARVELDRHDMVALSAVSDEFHTGILAGSPNRPMVQWIEMLSDQRRLLAVREWTSYDRAAAEHAEHHAILGCIAARDAEGAATLLSRHISTSAGAPPTWAEGAGQ
ncbi:MAG: GntR family transcriptional regulator [Acetobacteraceae bacterium]|nr:GntR family transcriptional regulator [Acetobacteraceae bacterium]